MNNPKIVKLSLDYSLSLIKPLFFNLTLQLKVTISNGVLHKVPIIPIIL